MAIINYNGFIYRRDKYIGSTEYWQCKLKGPQGCRARLISKKGRTEFIKKEEHSCRRPTRRSSSVGDLPNLAAPPVGNAGNSKGGQIEDAPDSQGTKFDKQKIVILLNPKENAPIIRKKKWIVESNKSVLWMVESIKNYMNLDPHQKLFLYVNETFALPPNQIMKTVYDSYSTEKKLVLHYGFR